jgi:hypothetical protein
VLVSCNATPLLGVATPGSYQVTPRFTKIVMFCPLAGAETNTTINPLSYFCLPINSNNYIEIVFGISNINKLSQWINMIDDTDIELLDFVMGLFWKNYYNIIDEDMDSFIGVNRKIIKKFMYKDIDNNIIVKIVNRLIKNNYGKKIKYINKIKKYLTKYI